MPRPTLRVIIVGALVSLSACSGDGGTNIPLDVPQIAGIWTGTFEIEGATFPAMMTISQDDRVVGGTIEIVQHLPPSAIIAAIDDFGNVVMVIEKGCEEWFGQLFVSEGDQRLEGSLEIDRFACEEGINEFGVLRVTR